MGISRTFTYHLANSTVKEIHELEEFFALASIQNIQAMFCNERCQILGRTYDLSVCLSDMFQNALQDVLLVMLCFGPVLWEACNHSV
jgi:hypothetical protein